MATNTEFKFGIWERLGVVALVVGVAGVVASVTLPPAIQEQLALSGLGPILFWGSLAVIFLAVIFFICDLAFYVLTRMGVGMGIALASIGTAFIVVGAIIGLIGAFKIDHPLTPREVEDARVAPDVLLLWVPGQLQMHYRGPTPIKIWGTQFDSTPAVIETKPRIINGGQYYYFLSDHLEREAITVLGQNGDKLEPFEVYIQDKRGDRYVANFGLLFKVTNGATVIHTQQLGVAPDQNSTRY